MKGMPELVFCLKKSEAGKSSTGVTASPLYSSVGCPSTSERR